VETHNEALAMESSGWKGKDKGKDKKKVKCYNCHKTRHYKSECWAKGGGKEGQGLQWGKGAKDNTALAKDKSEEDEAWATIEDIDKPTHTTHSNNVATPAGCPTMQSSQGHVRVLGKLYNSGALQHMSPSSVKKNMSYSYLFPSYPQNKRNKM